MDTFDVIPEYIYSVLRNIYNPVAIYRLVSYMTKLANRVYMYIYDCS